MVGRSLPLECQDLLRPTIEQHGQRTTNKLFKGPNKHLESEQHCSETELLRSQENK